MRPLRPSPWSADDDYNQLTSRTELDNHAHEKLCTRWIPHYDYDILLRLLTIRKHRWFMYTYCVVRELTTIY